MYLRDNYACIIFRLTPYLYVLHLLLNNEQRQRPLYYYMTLIIRAEYSQLHVANGELHENTGQLQVREHTHQRKIPYCHYKPEFKKFDRAMAFEFGPHLF